MTGPGWPDARGWIGSGIFALVLLILLMLWLVPSLRADEFFKTIAALIVGAFIKDVVAWAFGSTKYGGELSERNADLVAQQAKASPPINGGEKP